MGMGYAPTWFVGWAPPLLHKTTLTTVHNSLAKDIMLGPMLERNSREARRNNG